MNDLTSLFANEPPLTDEELEEMMAEAFDELYHEQACRDAEDEQPHEAFGYASGYYT